MCTFTVMYADLCPQGILSLLLTIIQGAAASSYFMKNKSEVFNKFKEFELATSNACGCTLRTDNGGEYLSKAFDYYLQSRGIYHELSAPYSPAQNGVAERFNRNLNGVRTCHDDSSRII